MARKGIIILILAVFVVTGAFAQKNTITYDVGPTIVGLAFNSIESVIPEDNIKGNGLGLAFQYERQLFQNLSVAGRFAYLKLGTNYTDYSQGLTIGLDMTMSSYSIEGHVRLYPFSETFFLDGMVGYANFSSDFFGQAMVDNIRETIDFDAKGDYLKLGAKLGWRMSLGRSGGFTIEPSIGYYHGIAMGDSVGQQFSDYLDGDAEIKEAFDILEKFVFVGGPRISLAFGWRF